MEPSSANPTPVVKAPVPVGGYVTRKVAGIKRFEDNADVLNFKCSRRSDNMLNPPPLRLEWNDKVEVDHSGSEIGPPHARITRVAQSSRAMRPMPKAPKGGSNVERVATQLGSAAPSGTLSNATHGGRLQHEQKPDGATSVPGRPAPSTEHSSGAQTKELPQHHELLQQLLREPAQHQYQQQPLSVQTRPQFQQHLLPSQTYQQVPPSQGQYRQQPQPIPPHLSSPEQHDCQQPPRPDVRQEHQFHDHRQPSPAGQTHPPFQQHLPSSQSYQQVPPQGQYRQQPQPIPPPLSSPGLHDYQPLPRDCRQPSPAVQTHPQFQQHLPSPQAYQQVPPSEEQYRQQPQPIPPPSSEQHDCQQPPRQDVRPQHQFQAPPPRPHWPQQRVYASEQASPEVRYQVGADAAHVMALPDERTQQTSNAIYESVLLQLIQRVGFASIGRMMTEQEAIDSWNQLDDGQKRNLHANVCIALAQLYGGQDGGSASAVPTTHPMGMPAPNVQHAQSLRDHDMAGPEVHTVADSEMESSNVAQESELGFGSERMENLSAPIHSDTIDFDVEEAVQDSNTTARPAQRGEGDVVMRNGETVRDVNVGEDEVVEDYPSGVDGFGFPVDDAEDDRINVNQVEHVANAVVSGDAGLRAERASDPLLLVLIRKFGTLVDAINRQTDAIQSMDTMLRDYVEESRKILAQVTPTGNAAGEDGDPTSNDATQTIVPPGIARKIQDRVAQITGKVVERSPGEAEKASLKQLKERVRSHLLTLLGVPSLDLLATRCRPFTQDEIDGYLADDGSVECSPHSFRIDFEREWRRFCINKEAREVFIENFLDVMMGSGMAQDQTIPDNLLQRDLVGQILDVYVTGTLRKKYKELLQLAPQPRGGEDDQEAKQRVQAAQKKHDEAMRKAARISRRTTIFVARNVVTAVTPSLQRHALLFARLTALNMSDDESDGPRKAVPRKFRIIVAEWQSDKLREFLWELDRQYRANWDETPKAKRRPGNTPRDRKLKADSRSEPGVAPQGLWRNCYNSEWLSKLNRHDRNRLQILDSDYDFPDSRQNGQSTASS